MSKGSGPAPDFMGLADRMGNWNLGAINQQTLANRPNQRTPFGSTTWTQTPGGWSPDLGNRGMGAGGGQGGGGTGLGGTGLGGGGLGGGGITGTGGSGGGGGMTGTGGIGGTGGGVGPGGMPTGGGGIGPGTVGGGLGLLGGGTGNGGGSGGGGANQWWGGGLGSGGGGIFHFGAGPSGGPSGPGGQAPPGMFTPESVGGGDANRGGGDDTDLGGGTGLSGGGDILGGPGNGGGFVGPGGPAQGGTDGGGGGPANQLGGLDDGGGGNPQGGGGATDPPPKGGGGPAFGGGPTQGGTGSGGGTGGSGTGGMQPPGPDPHPPPGFTPWGAPGQWTQETTLAPVAQQSLDAQMDLQRQRSQFGQGSFGKVRDALGRPVDFGGMPSLTPLGPHALGDLGNGDGARNRAEDALYQRQSSRLDPQWSQREDQLRTRLANQGLDPSSQAYQTEMGNFQRGENDAYDQARNSAIAGGGQEQQMQYGMNLGANQQRLAAQQQGFGQSAQARQQGIAELLQKRELPMNEMQALLNGQSVQSPQFPSFMGAGAPQSPNYLGAGQAQGNYNLQNQGLQNQMWGDIGSGIGSFAPMLAMLSDERAKCNIRRLPLDIAPGVPLALFEYRHEPGREYAGVIAQDVERDRPDAVTEINGLKHVYYGKLLEGGT